MKFGIEGFREILWSHCISRSFRRMYRRNTCLEGLRKSTKVLDEVSRRSSWDFNWPAQLCKSASLTQMCMVETWLTWDVNGCPVTSYILFWYLGVTDVIRTCSTLYIFKHSTCFGPTIVRTRFSQDMHFLCVKVIQLHALRVSDGWVFQISRQSAHEGGKVVSPMHRPSSPPRNISWYHFC